MVISTTSNVPSWLRTCETLGPRTYATVAIAQALVLSALTCRMASSFETLAAARETYCSVCSGVSQMMPVLASWARAGYGHRIIYCSV